MRTYLAIPYALRISALSLLLALACSCAWAVPRLDQQSCAIFADMALGARVLAREGIEQPLALRIMEQWFEPIGEGKPLTAAVVKAAYQDPREPDAFARAFFSACQAGRLDGFLGISV